MIPENQQITETIDGSLVVLLLNIETSKQSGYLFKNNKGKIQNRSFPTRRLPPYSLIGQFSSNSKAFFEVN